MKGVKIFFLPQIKSLEQKIASFRLWVTAYIREENCFYDVVTQSHELTDDVSVLAARWYKSLHTNRYSMAIVWTTNSSKINFWMMEIPNKDHELNKKFITIYDISVYPKGKGIWTELWDILENFAKENNCDFSWETL